MASVCCGVKSVDSKKKRSKRPKGHNAFQALLLQQSRKNRHKGGSCRNGCDPVPRGRVGRRNCKFREHTQCITFNLITHLRAVCRGISPVIQDAHIQSHRPSACRLWGFLRRYKKKRHAPEQASWDRGYAKRELHTDAIWKDKASTKVNSDSARLLQHNPT